MTRYYCKHCDKFWKRYEVPNRSMCPDCDKAMMKKSFSVHDDPFINKEIAGERPNWDSQHIENIRWSDAMGINPDQRAEFGKKFPWMEFDREGRCKVSSRHEKLKIMKARGFTERG